MDASQSNPQPTSGTAVNLPLDHCAGWHYLPGAHPEGERGQL